jgi:putative transposase
VAIRTEMALDEFVIMPNHLHGILFITARGAELAVLGATGRSPLRPRGSGQRSLGAFVAGFKAAATRRVRDVNGNSNSPLWQRGYYEHIIRGDHDLDRIRRYVSENPGRWAEDSDNPANRR